MKLSRLSKTIQFSIELILYLKLTYPIIVLFHLPCFLLHQVRRLSRVSSTSADLLTKPSISFVCTSQSRQSWENIILYWVIELDKKRRWGRKERRSWSPKKKVLNITFLRRIYNQGEQFNKWKFKFTCFKTNKARYLIILTTTKLIIMQELSKCLTIWVMADVLNTQ